MQLNGAIAPSEVSGNSPAARKKHRIAIITSKIIPRTCTLFDNNFLHGKGRFSKYGLLKYFAIILFFFYSA